MSGKRIVAIISLLLAASLLLPASQPAARRPATADSPPWQPPLPHCEEGLPGFEAQPFQTPAGLWAMAAGEAAHGRPDKDAPLSSGGPDDFGYTWTDSVPLNWIDASGGIDTGIDGSTDHAGPIDIGFPFKYYENTYSQVYASRFGFLAFSDRAIYNSQSEVPSPEPPDDVIAPHWVPSYDNPGYVRYLRGGAAPNRWFLVEWNRQVSNCCGDGAEEYTFEAILQENGNIVFQYGNMVVNGNWYCQASGIEDSSGLDGLTITDFCRQVAGNHAVQISRPAPTARVRVNPQYQGHFIATGETTNFTVSIRNTGELGADTYDLSVASPWPVTLFSADGVTPLTDTNGNGMPDTGPVAQGSTKLAIAHVTTPASAALGDHNTLTVNVRSSLNTARNKTATMQAAIPAPFVQIYDDYVDGAMSLMLAHPQGQAVRQTTPNSHYGANLSIAQTPSGDFFYAWTKGRWINNVIYVREIQYVVLDNAGRVSRGATIPFDLGQANVRTYDYPVVAVTGNGHVGILWYRYLSNPNDGSWNYNVFFASLDAAGNVVSPPTNLTNNSVWGFG